MLELDNYKLSTIQRLGRIGAFFPNQIPSNLRQELFKPMFEYMETPNNNYPPPSNEQLNHCINALMQLNKSSIEIDKLNDILKGRLEILLL